MVLFLDFSCPQSGIRQLSPQNRLFISSSVITTITRFPSGVRRYIGNANKCVSRSRISSSVNVFPYGIAVSLANESAILCRHSSRTFVPVSRTTCKICCNIGSAFCCPSCAGTPLILYVVLPNCSISKPIARKSSNTGAISSISSGVKSNISGKSNCCIGALAFCHS